jgi:small subunit ribosomal protein S18
VRPIATVAPKKKKRRMLMRRKRTLDPSLIIDYKNPDILKRFITDRGKIIPRRISGATQEQQRRIALAIKRARFIGLIPYAINHRTERGFAGEIQNAIQAFTSASMRSSKPTGPSRMSDAMEKQSREDDDFEDDDQDEE